MNMKYVLAFILATLTTVSALAETRGPIRRKDGKPTGGFIEVPNNGKVIQIVNDGGCDARQFTSLVAVIEDNFGFPVSTTAVAKEGSRDTNSVARVVLNSNEGNTILLCAPDDGWAVVNTKPLKADDPVEFVLRQRIQKETLRALGFALGGGYSAARPCLMTEAETLDQLDALPKTFGPEPTSKTKYLARKRGAVVRQFVSYRNACIQGWAPAPTNDLQKAILEEVKSEKERGPINAIQIKP